MVQVVVLSANGEPRTLKTSAIAEGAPATGAAVAKALRKTKPAEAVGTYKWKGGSLTVWGWKEGKAGTENKHELPPPLDEILLFSDAVVVSSSGVLTVEGWKEFYNAAMGGFEDLGSEDSEDEEEEEADEEADEEEVDEEPEAEEDDVSEEESAAEDEESAAEEEEEEEEAEEEDGDCYDDENDGGGGAKRRAPRRRTIADPEYRRMDMGLRSRVRMPAPPTKRAPRWQTAPELTAEEYTLH
jgi:hypothetical protein